MGDGIILIGLAAAIAITFVGVIFVLWFRKKDGDMKSIETPEDIFSLEDDENDVI